MAQYPKTILRKAVNDPPNNSAVSDKLSVVQKPVLEESSMESQMQTSVSFLPDDGSQMSRDVDRWIYGSETQAPVNTGVQRSRLTTIQRSTYTIGDTRPIRGRFLYMLTILIPLIKTHQRALWSRSTGAVLNSLEPVFTQIGQLFHKIHGEFRRFTTDHVVQETLTTALDIILVVYAIGFLFIALYQSSNMA